MITGKIKRIAGYNDEWNSQGIQLEDGQWYNYKGTQEECEKFFGKFKEGDKISLEIKEGTRQILSMPVLPAIERKESSEDMGLAVAIVRDSLQEAREIMVEIVKNKAEGEELFFTPEHLLELADQIRRTKIFLRINKK